LRGDQQIVGVDRRSRGFECELQFAGNCRVFSVEDKDLNGVGKEITQLRPLLEAASASGDAMAHLYERNRRNGDRVTAAQCRLHARVDLGELAPKQGEDRVGVEKMDHVNLPIGLICYETRRSTRRHIMTASPLDKANRFRALHSEPGCFVIANAWDAGSARILAGLGFAALATSSGAMAGVLGRRDGRVAQAEALAHASVVAAATELPVSADLEKGFEDAPAGVAETIRLAAETGIVGCTIEDFTGNSQQPLYDPGQARERIAAAVDAAHRLPFPFTLTARAEGFLRGKPDLDDVIKRLQAFEAAGADVLMAPGLPDLAAVRTVCAALSRPFNFMAGVKGRSFPVAELAAAGVKRISLATSLYRAAMSGLVDAAREVKERGSFGYVDATMATPELNRFMSE
jgi:2-methylisocitrate lyase-like PEP mutase family enzyme